MPDSNDCECGSRPQATCAAHSERMQAPSPRGRDRRVQKSGISPQTSLRTCHFWIRFCGRIFTCRLQACEDLWGPVAFKITLPVSNRANTNALYRGLDQISSTMTSFGGSVRLLLCQIVFVLATATVFGQTNA